MLTLVVDANILFSFFRRETTTRELITRFELFRLHSPELAIEELLKYRKLICEKSKLKGVEFEEALKRLKLFVRFEKESFFKEFLPEAKRISPDIDDVAYFALALKLGCGIWSNDKRLKKQTKIKILTTKDILELIG